MGANVNKRLGFSYHITEQELLYVKYLDLPSICCQIYLLKYLNYLPISCRLSLLSAVLFKLLILRVEQMLNKVEAKQNKQMIKQFAK